MTDLAHLRGRSVRCWRLAVLVAVAVLLLACAETREASESPTGYQYTVRGLVKSTSGLVSDPARLRVQHEAVMDLVGADGVVEPMKAMTMSLTLMPGTELPEDLAPDSKIEFVLDVDWNRAPVAMISSARLLDPATELVFD